MLTFTLEYNPSIKKTTLQPFFDLKEKILVPQTSDDCPMASWQDSRRNTWMYEDFRDNKYVGIRTSDSQSGIKEDGSA